MLVDKACFERGCACYDDRVDGPGVEVVAREWQGLTRDEVEELFWAWSKNTEYKIPLFEFRHVYTLIESNLKEKTK